MWLCKLREAIYGVLKFCTWRSVHFVTSLLKGNIKWFNRKGTFLKETKRNLLFEIFLVLFFSSLFQRFLVYKESEIDKFSFWISTIWEGKKREKVDFWGRKFSLCGGIYSLAVWKQVCSELAFVFVPEQCHLFWAFFLF